MTRILSIAGSGRGVGKTAVGCALIEALPQFRWTAIKATSHWHGAGMDGRGLSGPSEESDRNSGKDTSRYLAAGAVQAWLTSGLGLSLDSSIEDVMAGENSARSVILLECGSSLDGESPSSTGAGLLVLGADPSQWKPLTTSRLLRADAIIFPESLSACQVADLLSPASRVRLFGLPKGRWAAGPLVEFVRSCLESGRGI